MKLYIYKTATRQHLYTIKAKSEEICEQAARRIGVDGKHYAVTCDLSTINANPEAEEILIHS
jgi:hypothetical protein